MSNIHHLHGEAAPRRKDPARKPRGPYRKKVTAAEIKRAVQTAEDFGMTVYGFTVDGDKIHVQTKPGPETASSPASAVDDWFARRG